MNDCCSLVVFCVECDEEKAVPFVALSSLDGFAEHLAADHWLLSVLSPPGEPDVLMGPLCGPCAKKVHHPDVLAAVAEAMS